MLITPAPLRMAICGLLLLAPLASAAIPKLPTLDYTRVDLIPDRVGFWLGPLGVRALKQEGDEETKLEAQMQVTIVEEGSPAAGRLKPGDVILGVAGKTLSLGDPRRPICNAIIEVENDGGEIALDIWRPAKKAPVGDLRSNKKVHQNLVPAATRLPGEQMVVRVPLARLGRYSETSPNNCERSANIIKNGIRFIKEKDKSFGALRIDYFALLATGEKDDIAFCKKKMIEAKMDVPTENISHSMMEAGKASWGLGYSVALMSEYTLLTGDQTFVPALKTEARRVALAQDDNGLWYHNLSMPYLARGTTEGRVIGYGPVNATGLGCLQGIVLAKKAGISDPLVDAAIARGLHFFRNYVDNGRVGYGFSEPTAGEASNGKNSIAAVIFGNAGDFEAMRYFTKCSIVARERAGGHCGGYLNQLWGGLGANIGSPEGAENYFRTRRWYETSVRGWDGSFRYQFVDGTSYGEGTYGANTGAYLLSYLSSRRGLQILGKSVPASEYLSKTELAETLYTARHFLEKADELPDMKAIKAADLPDEEIYTLLGNWATGLRERAAYNLLARKPADVVSRIQAILLGNNQRAVLGASYYLRLLRKGEKFTPKQEMAERNAFADKMADAATDAMLKTKNDYLANQLANGIGSVAPNKIAALLARIESSKSQNRGLHGLMFRSTFGERGSKVNPLQLVRDKGIDPDVVIRWARMSAIDGGEAWMLEPLVQHASPKEILMLLEPLLRNAEFDTNLFTTAFFRKNQISEARGMIQETILTRKPNMMWDALKAAKSYGGNLKAMLPALYQKRATGDPRDAREQKSLSDIINVIEKDTNPAPMVSIHDLLAEHLTKQLAGKSPTEKAKLLRSTLASLPKTDEIYCGLLLGEYVKLDPTAALPFLINALGPPDNYRQRAAIDIAAKNYPLQTWLEQLKNRGDDTQIQAGTLHVLRKIGKGASPAIPLQFLKSQDFHVQQAAILLLGDMGGPAEAAVVAKQLNEADRSETAAIEEAINSIHKRTPLDHAFFQTLAADLAKYHVNETAEPDLLFREDMITSDLPGPAGLRILALSKDNSLLAPFLTTKNRYQALVTKLVILNAPLKIRQDGSLDPATLEKFKFDNVVEFLIPALELGQIDKNLQKPLSQYLIARAKTEKRLGDTAQKYLARLGKNS